MHHHLFPTEDTYITNLSGYEDKNFGITEIMRIGTSGQNVRTQRTTKDYNYTNAEWVNYCATDFTGIVSGSFTGSAVTVSGSINLLSSFISESFSGSLSNFYGEITSSSGRYTASVTGVDTRNENWWQTTSTKYVDRTLIKFDLTAISNSIVAGEITNPSFKLNLKVCNEYNLPISYKIYAFAVSQSWTMGNGYYSDGGSDTGTSWLYRDYSEGADWYTPVTTSLRPVVDFLNVPANATGSFAYGGGTWHYPACTQSFSYESADVSMDVTSIVNSWLNGTVPNEGIILLSSDEIANSGSGFSLTFYAKDTNSINSPYLDVMWDDWSWDSGSVVTSSVVITSSYSGFDVSIQTGSTFSIAGGIHGTFSSSLFITNMVPTDNVTTSFTGIVLGRGLDGNIQSLPIIGMVSGSMDLSQSVVTGSCGKTFLSQMVTASFTNGVFNGVSFTSYYVNSNLENARITGSWPAETVMGAHVVIPMPSGIEPYAYAYVSGAFVSGKAFGLYQTSGSTSASFSGQFIEGSLVGGVLNLQLSGSVATSSYDYTSSVEFSQNAFVPVDTNQSFTVIVKNLKPEYKGGDMARIKVFARREFPMRTFQKASQQSGYIVPELLPTSSYYAIKDNMSEEIIIDFDNYTRISAEYPEGNFFMLDTTGLAQERPYRILIRVENSGSKYTFDNGDVFKITR